MATSKPLSIAKTGSNFENFNFFVVFSAYRVQKSIMLNLSHTLVSSHSQNGRQILLAESDTGKIIQKMIYRISKRIVETQLIYESTELFILRLQTGISEELQTPYQFKE
jgi:hypothetical protein